jgi:hypothetical protein
VPRTHNSRLTTYIETKVLVSPHITGEGLSPSEAVRRPAPLWRQVAGGETDILPPRCTRAMPPAAVDAVRHASPGPHHGWTGAALVRRRDRRRPRGPPLAGARPARGPAQAGGGVDGPDLAHGRARAPGARRNRARARSRRRAFQAPAQRHPHPQRPAQGRRRPRCDRGGRWRGRAWRHRGVRSGDLHAGHPPGARAHHPRRPGRQRHWRQGRRQPSARQEPDRRVPPSPRGRRRSVTARHAPAAGVQGGHVRGDQVRRHRERRVVRHGRRLPLGPACPRCQRARPGDRRVLSHQGAHRDGRRVRDGPQATRSDTPSRA